MKADHVLMLAGTLVLCGCAAQQPPPHVTGRTMRRVGTEPECFRVKNNDTEMKQAVRMARRNVGTFIAALKNPAPGQSDFEVKKRFEQGSNVEHIWLAKVQYSGGRFHGLVDNHPQNITGLKMGQRVSVNPDEISDWLFIDHGKLVGGYTIRVLYNSLSPERKQEFEKGADFRIEAQ